MSTLRSDMAGYNISGEGGGVDWILMKTATAKSSHDFECLLECLRMISAGRADNAYSTSISVPLTNHFKSSI